MVMNRFAAMLLSVALGFPAYAQYAGSDAYSDLYDSETVSSFKKHVSYVTAADFEGRKAGSEGEKAVAEYVYDCLKGYGVEMLTGADGGVILSHKRPVKDVDYGFVGDVDRVDGGRLSTLVEAGLAPVLAPLTHDGRGQMLNTNADTIAAETAKAMAGRYDVTLIFCFEKPGVLADPDNDDSLIPVITRADFERYAADGTVSGGMLPKLENAFAAIDAGVSRVNITLATAIDGRHGTMILP